MSQTVVCPKLEGRGLCLSLFSVSFPQFDVQAKLVGYKMNVTCLCTVLDLKQEDTDICIRVLTKAKMISLCS